MSAECNRCGHDLAYDLSCAVCDNRERAVAAERELQALRETLRELVRAYDALPGHTALPVVQVDWRNALAAARAALSTTPDTEEEQ
jgi:hypothetical protein